MKRLYDDNLYKFDTPQPSYWEATASGFDVPATPLQSAESCDIAIIGGGYTGLSAALHMARDYSLDVRVLEAGHIGWGASGRNGGFCCVGGSGVHGKDLVKLRGEDNARDFYRSQVDAVELVRQLADDEGIEFQTFGGAELEVAHTPGSFERLQEDHELRSKTLDLESEIVSAGEFRERYFDSTEQFGALVQRPGFGLHPLQYCRGLANAAIRRGAVLHDRSEVLEWSKTDSGAHRLLTSGGSITARRVLFATNGFMPERLKVEFYGRTIPVVSAIIVTRPLTDNEKEAHNWLTEHPVINSRNILNYFRMLPDNRFLFGGRGHNTGHASGERQTAAELTATLRRFWPAWSGVEIDFHWHGLICYTRTLTPCIGQLDDDPSVYFGFGYHGNGVSAGTWTGKQLADWVGSGRSSALPEIVKGLGRKFPLASMRLKYLQLGLALSGWLDRRA